MGDSGGGYNVVYLGSFVLTCWTSLENVGVGRYNTLCSGSDPPIRRQARLIGYWSLLSLLSDSFKSILELSLRFSISIFSNFIIFP